MTPRSPLIVALLLAATAALADPGGKPNQNSAKKHAQRVESGQGRADEVRIIAVGGYRNENLYESGERWRADKAKAHQGDKALRDREAQERLAREQVHRTESQKRDEQKKLADQQARDAQRTRKDVAKAKTVADRTAAERAKRSPATKKDTR